MSTFSPNLCDDETSHHDTRILHIEGIHNLRDLGGLPARGTHQTAGRRLYRSEFFKLAGTAANAVSGLGLRLVVDLRREDEVLHERLNWEDFGVAYLNRPLRLSEGTSWTAGYHLYLETDPRYFAEVIRTLANPDNHPALFHCAGGKDRTGVIAAMLLDLAGVPRGDIVADFALTRRGLAPIIERLQQEEHYKAVRKLSLDEHMPKVEKMVEFFDWLDVKWGGSEHWLLHNGMRPEEISAFRSAVLVQDAGAKLPNE